LYSNIAPTKANLIRAKSMLAFSIRGYELLDKKRNVLIREMMGMMTRATQIQTEIQEKFEQASESLKISNMLLGTQTIEEISISIPKDEEFGLLSRSVMGVELPVVRNEPQPIDPSYGLFRTNSALDNAVESYNDLRRKLYELAEVETSIYKLAMEIKKTQKRTNALDRIQIPKYRALVKAIAETLEEKEREDFFRLKKVKKKAAVRDTSTF
jgi:V/A-type H+-transporting ATPase subunit D